VQVKSKGKGKSRMEQFREAAHRHPMIVPALSLDEGIAAVRAFLPTCEFDVGPCVEGLKALRAYRKEWNEDLGTWRSAETRLEFPWRRRLPRVGLALSLCRATGGTKAKA
jgi:hypothetical protein